MNGFTKVSTSESPYKVPQHFYSMLQLNLVIVFCSGHWINGVALLAIHIQIEICVQYRMYIVHYITEFRCNDEIIYEQYFISVARDQCLRRQITWRIRVQAGTIE